MKKFQLPPTKASKPATKAANKVSEKKIMDVISKGGGITKSQAPDAPAVFKNVNIEVMESELETINELREKRQRPRGGKRLGISLKGWIIEAIQEKIARESKR